VSLIKSNVNPYELFGCRFDHSGGVKMVTKVAEIYLQPVLQEKVFWCRDGKVLASIDELYVALDGMSEETYSYHANSGKNDFSKWIRDVIGDKMLADNLEKVLLKDEAKAKVSARIKSLKTGSAKKKKK
jgi:hypothetical protein